MISRKEIEGLKNQDVSTLKKIYHQAEKEKTLSYSDLAYFWNMIIIKQRKEKEIARLEKRIQKGMKNRKP